MNDLAVIYIQQFKTTFASMLQYRASLFIWMIGAVLEPLIYLIVWSTVSLSRGGSVGDYTAGQFAAYFIVFMLVNQVTYTWIMYEYEYRIREGLLSPALLRPVHPIHADIAENISSKLISMPVMILIAGGLALIFKPSVTFLPWSILVFIPALFLAFLVRFLIEWSLAQSAFWTTRVGAFNQLYFVLVLFLSGQIAPLSLFPRPIQVLADILPFRWMIGYPVELILGRLSPLQAVTGLGAQTIWLIISLGLVRIVWRAGIRIYSAVGA